jgi:hypothetical protein
MPDGLVPDEGLARGLEWTLNNGDTQLDAWQLMIFVNDFEPDEDTVLADLVEPSWPGYARYAMVPGGWDIPAIIGHVAESVWGTDPVEFLNATGATETVYGCGYFDPLFGVLRFVQRFDAGDIRAIAAGESVQIIPRFTRRGQSP